MPLPSRQQPWWHGLACPALIASALAITSPALSSSTLASPTPAASTSTVVRHIYDDDQSDRRNSYFIALLTLALDQTLDSHGPYRLEGARAPMPQSRALSELAAGQTLDVVWTMTTPTREARLRTVRIPIERGLSGYRLLLIREEDQDRFASITDLSALRTLRAGQGHDWPDADILAANDLPVERVSDYEPLFRMLEQGRFDYLPRMAIEAWAELEARPEKRLTVAPGILLYYPTANYFFVHPDNASLAERIDTGLRRALDDGSFLQLFHEHPIQRDALARSDLANRRHLILDNPLLPAATPLDDPRLWFSP